MPVLREFCYFCGLGVIFLFFFVSTFFVACVLLDERRKQRQISSRPDWSPAQWTRSRPGLYIFKNWISPCVVWKPVSLLIILVAVGLAAAGVYGLVNIESDYDSIWYMVSRQQFFFKYYNIRDFSVTNRILTSSTKLLEITLMVRERKLRST